MRTIVRINSSSEVLRDHGLDRGGDAQKFWTVTVMRHMQRRMPYRSGLMIKRMLAATDLSKPLIVIPGPEVRMLYHGKVMVDPQTGAAGFLTADGWKSRKGVKKSISNRDIEYTTTKNPEAGPYWDRRTKAADMPAMAREMQAYIDRRG